MKPNSIIKTIIILLLVVIGTNCKAQWAGSTVSTYTTSDVIVGPYPCSLFAAGYDPQVTIFTDNFEGNNKTNLRIVNTQDGLRDHNIMEVYNHGTGSSFCENTLFFVINGAGQTGINMQPDVAKGFSFSVAGTSNFGSKVLIGDANLYSMPNGYNLFVQDGILTEKIKVANHSSSDWSDFVFDKNYNLPSLQYVEKYIQENKHLPEIPSAKEVATDGIDLAQMDAKLLQKIEELTLYMIDQKKEIAALKTQNNRLQKKIKALDNNH